MYSNKLNHHKNARLLILFLTSYLYTTLPTTAVAQSAIQPPIQPPVQPLAQSTLQLNATTPFTQIGTQIPSQTSQPPSIPSQLNQQSSLQRSLQDLQTSQPVTHHRRRHRHHRHQHHHTSSTQHAKTPKEQKHPQQTPHPTPTVTPTADNDVPISVLLKSLPPSWQATVLDTPLPPPQPLNNTATAHTPSRSSPPATSPTSSTQPQTPPTSVNRILLPIPPNMGIAAFRSGNTFIIVVDNTHPMNTSAIQGDGIFSTLTVNTLPDATLIKLTVPDNRQLYLSQQVEGWILGDVPPPDINYADRHVITPRLMQNGILYPMRRPGRVLSITDPTTNTRLLIGTSTTDDGGILSLRHGNGYDVWPTLEGVVIAAHSPDITMRATSQGIFLTAQGQTFPDEGVALYASDVDFKWLGLRNLPLAELERRREASIIAAADSEPAERFARRFQTAQAYLSAGFFTGARSVLRVALQDDPDQISHPDVRFLLAVTNLLSGHPDKATLLNEPWPSKEQRAVQLWRGLYLAIANRQGPLAAKLLAQDLTRLKNYPIPMRNTLLPIAAETIARYGNRKDLQALSVLPNAPAYQLAFAFRDMRLGERKKAYNLFHTLSLNKNIVLSEKASEQTISLKLADKKIKPIDAANAFSELIIPARLAGRSAIINLLEADAYMHAQHWYNALNAIDRAQKADHPPPQNVIAPMLAQTLQHIAENTTPSSNQGVILRNASALRAHLPNLPQGPEKAKIMMAYGSMLHSLGLIKQASQALSIAIPMLDNPVNRAAAGEELAAIELQQNKPEHALLILSQTDDPDLPNNVKIDRLLVTTNALIKIGDAQRAIDLLLPQTDPQSLNELAHIYETRTNWVSAAQTLQKLAQNTIPETGTLTPQQEKLALRLASDASQAQDKNILNWIQKRIGNRQLSTSNAPLFKLFTQQITTPIPQPTTQPQ